MTLFSKEGGLYLLSLAKTCIEHALIHEAPLLVDIRKIKHEFLLPTETCVSLEIGTRNLGCYINHMRPTPMFKSIIDSAYNAAFKDSCAGPVNKNSLSKATLNFNCLLPQRKFLLIESLGKLVDEIESDDTLVLRHEATMSIMPATEQKRYGSITASIMGAREKAGIRPEVNWREISACLIKTSFTYSLPYSEIPCLNID